MSAKKKSSEPSQTFEQSLRELQLIVDSLEQGKSGLEESLDQFERGIRLLRECYQKLDQAEKKLEILAGFHSSGTPVLQELEGVSSSNKDRPSKGLTEPASNEKGSSSLFE